MISTLRFCSESLSIMVPPTLVQQTKWSGRFDVGSRLAKIVQKIRMLLNY